LRDCLRWFCAAICAVFVAQPPAFAQSMLDPMRPPQARDESAAPGRSAGAGLQLIINSPRRKLALIDGRMVALGGNARDGTVVGLSDSSVVLRKNGSLDVVLMHPAIDKKPTSMTRRREP